MYFGDLELKTEKSSHKFVNPMCWKSQNFPNYVTQELEKANKVLLTGSRYICKPPVMDTDIDILLLVDDLKDFDESLLRNGWVFLGKEYEGDHKSIYRKNEYNFIIVDSIDLFTRWEFATFIGQELNLLEKIDRKNLFMLVEAYTKITYVP